MSDVMDSTLMQLNDFSLTWPASMQIYCESSTPKGLVWDTNMAAVSLFWDTNMSAVTSCENTLYLYLYTNEA